MAPREQETLDKLAETVNELCRKVDVIHTKLFGEDDKENSEGRIPRLEAAVKAHERKLRRVEPLVLLARGAWALVLLAGGAVLNHFLPSIKGH